MLRRLLVANRGDAACRILRTARRLGVATVAVYSEADAGAAHVRLAEQAVLIGPAPVAESYGRTEALLEAVRRSGADALHPGWGFLAERASLAAACEAAGIVFVGPPSAILRRTASKSEARAFLGAAGVPVLPGYDGDDQSDAAFLRAAESIGYPVMVKADGGGGGKGMRVVSSASALPAALADARREAAAAFGDPRLLLEQYVARARHLEVQVFGDRDGRVVHLFEREGSVQRRHQKVLEEAPAPGLSRHVREALFAAAVRAARAVGYVGAGTVEFLLGPDGTLAFIEMNPRLQVEHGLTELVTGQDLVEWQLRVASGEPLPLAQDALHLRGHALEARLYAEDPARDFLPSTGRLARFRLPGPGPHVRVETGHDEGDEISVHYDPLLAKVLVWDTDRPRAVARLGAALRDGEVVGPATNLPLLTALVQHPAFVRGAIDVGFLERHRVELLPAEGPAPDSTLALAALVVVLEWQAEAARGAVRGGLERSPWATVSGWRLNGPPQLVVALRDGTRRVEIPVGVAPDGLTLALPGGALRVGGELCGDRLEAALDGLRTSATVVRRGTTLTIVRPEGVHRLLTEDPLPAAPPRPAGAEALTAPMPGRIVQVLVAAGDPVARGAALLVLEAMKVEHTVRAPVDGRVLALPIALGAHVAEGTTLVRLAPTDGEGRA